MKLDELLADLNHLPEEVRLGGEGDAREVQLEEIGVTMTVNGRVEDGIDVGQQSLRYERNEG